MLIKASRNMGKFKSKPNHNDKRKAFELSRLDNKEKRSKSAGYFSIDLVG